MFFKLNSPLWLLLAVFVVIFSGGFKTHAAPHQFQNNELEVTHYRLAESVIPDNYEIELDLEEAFEKSPAFYTGSVVIDVRFGPRKLTGLAKAADCLLNNPLAKCLGLESSGNEESQILNEPNEIVMHADESVEISSVEVIDLDKNIPLVIKSSGRSKKHQMIVLKFAQNLPSNGQRGQIRMQFRAPVRTDNHGVYLSRDTSRGHNYQHVVAKFQPTFARLAMPCFDEPNFKATFRLSLKHKPSVTAYANMDVDKQMENDQAFKVANGDSSSVVTIFERTPPMSIHMVAFVVGHFDPDPLTEQLGPYPTIRFLSVPGTAHKGKYAMEVVEQAIDAFEDYSDEPFPLKKLDIVAISDTDTDNTETWGLVFIRDSLVFNDAETTQFNRVTTAVNVVHVVIHQWFGNLVTAKWWDDLWITESFASHLAFELVAQLYPDYESDTFVRLDLLTNILELDESGEQHPLSPPLDKLVSWEQIYQLFDRLTFMKSGSLARMLEQRIGEEQFRELVQSLLYKFAYKNVDFNDLLGEIELPGLRMPDIRRMLRSFSTQPGYPVVNVEVDPKEHELIVYLEPSHNAYETLHLSRPSTQEYHDQFQRDGAAWMMPLRVLLGDACNNKLSMKRPKFGVFPIATLELPDWFQPDEDFLMLHQDDMLAYHRVRYSDELLKQLESFSAKKDMSYARVRLLDDTSALAKSQLVPDETFRKLINRYAQLSDQPTATVAILKAAETLAQLEGDNEDQSSALQVSRRVFSDYKFQSSSRDTIPRQRARTLALMTLVNKDEAQVIHEALETFDGGKELAPFLREPIYAAVVKDGSQVRLEKLLTHLQDTDSYEERLRLASALAATNNKQVLEQLVKFLNQRSGFKQTTLETIVRSQPSLALEHGSVVLK